MAKTSTMPFDSGASVKSESDLLKWVCNQEYCVGTILLTNAGETELQVQIGTPLALNGTPIAAASIANVKAISLENAFVSAGDTQICKVALRGPALLNADALPTTDTAGATIAQAAFITALQALGFQFLYEGEAAVIGT